MIIDQIFFWMMRFTSDQISNDLTHIGNFFFCNSILHLTNKQNTDSKKNNTRTARNQNSSLLLLVNSKAKTKIFSQMNFIKKRK